MPALLPAPKPLFSCSITRASGNFSRTRPGVPSVDALSTTISSAPAPSRLPSERSTHSAALCVTTIALTSAIRLARHLRPPRAVHPVPGEDRRAGSRHQDRDHEEQEPGREGLVRADAEVPEETDEERLAHCETVDGERHEHHEKEQRSHHVVRPRRQVDADRLPATPHGEYAHRLDPEGHDEHREQ